MEDKDETKLKLEEIMTKIQKRLGFISSMDKEDTLSRKEIKESLNRFKYYIFYLDNYVKLISIIY